MKINICITSANEMLSRHLPGTSTQTRHCQDPAATLACNFLKPFQGHPFGTNTWPSRQMLPLPCGLSVVYGYTNEKTEIIVPA